MSRTFTRNTSNYMTLGANVLGNIAQGADEVVLAAWALSNGFNANTNFVIASVLGAGLGGLDLYVDASNHVAGGGRSAAADSFQAVTGVTTVTTGVYHHLASRMDFGASRIEVFLDGVSDKNSAVTFGSTTYAHTAISGGTFSDSIGCTINSSGVPSASTTQWNGDLAEVAIWKFTSGDASMTATDIAALASGLSPLRLNKGTLVWYMQLLGTASPETSLVSAVTGTITGTVSQDTHPTVYGYPSVFTRDVLRVA